MGADYEYEEVPGAVPPEAAALGVTARRYCRKENANGSGDVNSVKPTGKKRSTWPKELGEDAMHGLAGEVVKALAPHTESDPAALLVQTLVCFANAIGRHPYYQVEGDRHYANLFAVIVGDSSKARKGTSAGRVKEPMHIADPTWEPRTHGGMSSGEGLIWAVRDRITKIGKDGTEQELDAGVSDKRLMAFESEFAGVLHVMQREGNILSRVIRDAWDRGDLATMTKNSPARATGAFISIVGHITEEELRRSMDRTEMANGFANRFMYVCAKRARLLPHGGSLKVEIIAALGAELGEAITAARKVERVKMDDDAAKHWEKIYAELSAELPGLLGALTARSEAQVIRLALVYALLDRNATIEVVHLKAAQAVWAYCQASVRHIFGELLGDPDADTIHKALQDAGGKGLTRTEIRDLFNRNRSGAQINRALDYLEQLGMANQLPPTEDRPGRPTEVWVATPRN
jgi:hypothetical protein